MLHQCKVYISRILKNSWGFVTVVPFVSLV
jgi:hypothetical protein